MTEIPPMSGLDKLQFLQKSLGGLAEINPVSRLQELGLMGSAFKVNSLHDEAMKAAQLATAGLTATLQGRDAMMATQLASARLAAFQDNASLNAAHLAATKAAFDTSAFQGLFSHNEAMKALQREVIVMNGAMKAALDTAVFGSMADVLKSMKQLPDQSLLASIGATSDSLRKMTEVFSGSQHLHNLTATVGLSGQAYQDMIRAYGMDTIADRLSAFDWPDNITVNDDDSITIDESIIGSIEVRGAITQVVDTVTHQHLQELEVLLTQILDAVNKQKDPVIKQLLMPFFLGLFFLLATPVADVYIKGLMNDTQQMDKQGTDDVVPASYRLVTRKVLAVRASASSKSRSLGQLHANQVVVLIEERDGWARVSWSGKDDGVSLQGWVLTKYLCELQ